MRRALSFTVLLLVLGVGPASFAGTPGFQAGLWETQVVVTMEGLPVAVPPTKTTVKACHTADNAVPDTSDKAHKCDVVDQKIDGSRVTWKVVCKNGKNTSEGQGEITYAGDTYTGTVTTTIAAGGGQQFKSIMKLTGKRLGDCPK